MATIVQPRARSSSEASFFFISALVMAAVIVAGFSLAIAMGHSSFGAPWIIHLHAFVFFGWLVLYVLQNGLIAANNVRLHRTLGWLAVGWVPAMVVLGTLLTVINAKHNSPFFFDEREFLIGNPAVLLTFAGLAFWAISVRRNTGWHRRLMYCGMALLTGPGFGRFLPVPFLIPWAWWACFAAVMLFPLAGVIFDLRRNGRVHPAWWAGIATMTATFLLGDAIAFSPLGDWATHQVIDGTPGGARPIAPYLPWAKPAP
jgi:hypothetical protein